MKLCATCYADSEIPAGMYVKTLWTTSQNELACCDKCGELRPYVVGVDLYRIVDTDNEKDGENNQ